MIAPTNDMRMIAIKKDSGEPLVEVNAAAPTDPVTGTPSPRTQGSRARCCGQDGRRQGTDHPGREHRRLARHPQLGRRLEVGTGKLAWRTFTIPAPGERDRDVEGQSQCLARRRGGVRQTASYDPATTSLSRHRRCLPELRSAVPPPGDNLYTASTIALDADTGKIVWYFQTPNGID